MEGLLSTGPTPTSFNVYVIGAKLERVCNCCKVSGIGAVSV